MAKGRNNLLGVGGQRKKLSRAEQHGAGQGRNADRKAAADQKAELLKKMREKAGTAEGAGSESAGSEGAGSESASTGGEQ